MENECQVSACAVTAEEAHCPLGLSPTHVIFSRCPGPGRPEGRAVSFLLVSPVPMTAVGVEWSG